MEEDIEDLKELRKELGLHTDGNKIKQGIALEHLIKAYKELEEKNKKKSIEIICYQEELENSIPVSLVKEKIEEINKEDENLMYKNNIITVLQELLEERKVGNG